VLEVRPETVFEKGVEANLLPRPASLNQPRGITGGGVNATTGVVPHQKEVFVAALFVVALSVAEVVVMAVAG
jgi:hypothetical protein